MCDLKIYFIFVADTSGLDRDTNEDNEGSMANQRNAPRNSISPNAAAKEKAKKPFFKKVHHKFTVCLNFLLVFVWYVVHSFQYSFYIKFYWTDTNFWKIIIGFSSAKLVMINTWWKLFTYHSVKWVKCCCIAHWYKLLALMFDMQLQDNN